MEHREETLEPIVVTPEQELNVDSSEDNIFRTAEGERGNAEPIVGTEKKGQIVNTILVKEVKYLIKKAIAEALGKVGLKLVTVESLPETGDPGTIYLVPNESGSGQNLYDEYIWNVTTSAWEKIGPDVDLSNYVDLSSAQTITVEKTFDGDGKLKVNGKLYFINNNNLYNSLFSVADGLRFGVIGPNSARYFCPEDDALLHLGSRTKRWADIEVLKLKNDESNSGYGIKLPNMRQWTDDKEIATTDYFGFKRISYDDFKALSGIEKISLLDEGCQIIGTVGTVKNPILFPRHSYGSYHQGIAIGDSGGPFIGSWEVVGSIPADGSGINLREANGGIKIIDSTVSSINNISIVQYYKKPQSSVSLNDGDTIDNTLKSLIQNEQPIKLNGFTCYFSCDDGTNYQYVSTRYDSSANKNHINVITIDKSTWVATFHTSDIAI